MTKTEEQKESHATPSCGALLFAEMAHNVSQCAGALLRGGRSLSRTWAVAAALLAAFAAPAEIICYNGFPDDPSAAPSYCRGFSTTGLAPATSTYVVPVKSATAATLALPASFSDVSTILPVLGSKDGLVRMSGQGSVNSGAKVMRLTDNCQSRKGQLHFRFLIRAEQGAIDSLPKDETAVAPRRERQYVCGIVWSVDDYVQATTTNSALRYTSSLGMSSTHSDLSGSTAKINFKCGFIVGLFKLCESKVVMRLCAWGNTATDLTDDSQYFDFLSGVEGGKTYLCHVCVDIDHYGDGDDRIRAFAQPVDDYNQSCGWYYSPFVRSIRANVVDGSSDLYAHLLLQGPNNATSKADIDEIGLATSAEDLSLIDFADAKKGDLLAYDGFPCGTDAYPSTVNKQIGAQELSAVLTTNVFGFNGKWDMYIGKGTPVFRGDGSGLLVPECYAAAGVLSTPGTAISYGDEPTQGMYVWRKFSKDLLGLSRGDVLYMRFLISATDLSIRRLPGGPDNVGTLIAGTVGVKESVNYFGAGIADCSTQIESGESMAPTLCRRDNSCFVTITMNNNRSAGLYLNLLTADGDTPVAHKIADVGYSLTGSASYTYLCFVRIEVGTGVGGKERITGFAANVDSLADKWGANWFPDEVGQAIEHEIIGDAAYPRHAVVGGKAHPGFAFDEFALSLNSSDRLVWARRQIGLQLIFK